MSNRLTDLLALSHVPRWSIVPTTRPQSVADHSFRVAVIAYELADRFKIPLQERGLWYALWHDGPESRSGDIPGPFKRLLHRHMPAAEAEVCPWLGHQPSPDVWAAGIVKLADLIEGYTFILAYGVGAHASSVRARMFDEIIDQYNQCVCLMTGTSIGPAPLMQLIDEIVEERGRWTSPADPPEPSVGRIHPYP